MSKLAHSNDETMAEIERAARIAEIGRKVRTSYWTKPVPSDKFDWQAVFDDDEPDDDGRMMVGHGATEAEAIDELIDVFSNGSR